MVPTLDLAAVIARRRASFSAASESVRASQSSANTYSCASSASRICGGIEMIGGDRFFDRGKRAKSNGASARSTTWISANAGAACTTLTRVARPDSSLDKAVPSPGRQARPPHRHGRPSARSSRRRARALRPRRAAPAEQNEFFAMRSVRPQEPLGDVEHSPVEHARETLLGAERDDEMAAAVARPRRNAAVLGERERLADRRADGRRIGPYPFDRSRASRARAAAMPRIAPITEESWRTEPMRATTSLSRSVMTARTRRPARAPPRPGSRAQPRCMRRSS